MSNLRDLNQQNPFAGLLSALTAEGPDHPFFAAPDSEARDRGARQSSTTSPGEKDNKNKDENHTPSSSDDEASHPHAPPQGPGDRPPRDHPPHHHHPHHHPGRGRGGPWGRGGCRGRGPRHGDGQPPWMGAMGPGGFDLGRLVDFIQGFNPRGAAPPWAQGQNTSRGSGDGAEGKDFAPDADIFDTDAAFVVHVSLPGAKKEDIGVNYDADESELSIAGVIYRPGSEEFLKTLAVDERKVGVFERKIKLGSRETPAYVKEDKIGAKMEDGVLIVTIPKAQKEKAEVKKVMIE